MSAQALSAYQNADLYATFKEMRIKHPHHESAVIMFEKLRQRKIRAPNAEQTAVSLFAGSNSGKTTTVNWYIETVVVEDWLDAELRKASNDNQRQQIEDLRKNSPRSELAKLQSLVLYVELGGETTIGGLISDILEALGDPQPHFGTAKYRRWRVEKLLSARGYQLLIFDETQHIRTQTFTGPITRQEDATEVQNTLKRWVKRWPIIFVGTQHAQNVIFEHQVHTRSEPPIKFGPLHFGDRSDRAIFEEFCGRLCLKIAQLGVFPAPPMILVEDDVPLCLNIASKGRLGVVTIIVRIAIEIALGKGDVILGRHHLAEAVKSYSMRIKMCSSNPFTIEKIILPPIEEYERDYC